MDDTFPGMIFVGRRGGGSAAEWVFPIAATAQVQVELADRGALDAEAMERRRIASGTPAVPADVGPGDLPNEGGLEGAAISYTKGCYLGQEVMARLKSMGRVRRRLLRVTGKAADLPAVPAALFLGEKKIGELRSAVQAGDGTFAGLAMLSLMHLTPAAKLSAAANAAPTVQLADAP